MIKNPKKVLNQANKIARNLQTAEDVVQDVMIYFHERPNKVVTRPDTYVYIALLSRFNNEYKKWHKRMVYDGTDYENGTTLSRFETIFSEEKYMTVDKKIDMEKVLDVYEKSCYPMEKRALELILEHDTAIIDGESSSSLKTNRRGAIEKMNFFLENGFTKKSLRGKTKKSRKGIKNETISYIEP